MNKIQRTLADLAAVGATGSALLFSSLGVSPGDDVVIPDGTTVLMDVPATGLGSFTVLGTVKPYGTADFVIHSKSVFVEGNGFLDISNNGAAFTGNAEIEVSGARPTTSGNPGGGPLVIGPTHIVATPTGNNGTTNDNYGRNRAILVSGSGRIRAVANLPTVVRSRLAANVAAGDHTLSLRDPVYWKAGQKIVLWLSGFNYDDGSTDRRLTQELTIAADTNGSSVVSVVEAVNYARYGLQQYIVDDDGVDGDGITKKRGLQLTPGTLTTSVDGSWNGAFPGAARTLLDKSAEVMLMSSNIKFQGANDSDWTTYGYGMHGMAMDLSSRTLLYGVEFNRCGQAGLLGRYPWHWHTPSYIPNTGTYLGAYPAGAARIERCMIRGSQNRAIDLHAVRGAEVVDNHVWGSLGMAIFLEDASEIDNLIDGNWVTTARPPLEANQLKFFDAEPACFWFSNLHNTITNNRAADANRGIWNAILCKSSSDLPARPGVCFGLSAQQPIFPENLGVLLYEDNTAHSCSVFGFDTARAGVNENGFVNGGGRMVKTSNGLPTGGTELPSIFTRNTIYNCGWVNDGDNSGGYINSVSLPNYVGWQQFDNVGIDFQGATNAGFARDLTIVCKSLDPETVPSYRLPTASRQGFATYHGTLTFFNVIAVGYVLDTPSRQNTRGLIKAASVTESWDNYLDPVMRYHANNPGWKLINSFGQYLTPSPNIENDSVNHSYATWAINPVGDADLIGNTYGYPQHRGWSIGCSYDPWGHLTATPDNPGGVPGAYYLWNHPFVRYGITTTLLADSRANACWTMTPLFGITVAGTDLSAPGIYVPIPDSVTYQRVDSSHADVSGAFWQLRQYVDDLYGFKHTPVAHGQRVRISSPGHSPNQHLWIARISNMRRTTARGDGVTDHVFIGAPWLGTIAPTSVVASTSPSNDSSYTPGGTTLSLTSVASKAALDAATSSSYWQDTANDLVYLHLFPLSDAPGAVPAADAVEAFYVAIKA